MGRETRVSVTWMLCGGGGGGHVIRGGRGQAGGTCRILNV